jgi:hypothetical protein
MSGEYLFGGLPRLCLKGKLYPVSIALIIEGVPILLTSGIFSGDGLAATERGGNSCSSPDGIGSAARGSSQDGIGSAARDSSSDGVSFRFSSHSKVSHFSSSSSVSP